MNDPDVEKVERDQIVCVDIIPENASNTTASRKRGVPGQLTWNIDRLDERRLPLDGQFCPAASGK